MENLKKETMVVLPLETEVSFGKEVAYIVAYDEEVEAGDIVSTGLNVNYCLVLAKTWAEAQAKMKNYNCENDWYDQLVYWTEVVPTQRSEAN